jgi:CheY-like chemotaxis protein
MSKSASSNNGGFWRQLFPGGKAGQPAPKAVSNEIRMAPTVEQAAGKRLAKSKTVLIIAAPDAMTRRWKSELEQWGYGVQCVESGPQGLDILFEFAFDALLVDFQAPKVDGMPLLKEVRSHPELKGLFVGAFVGGSAGGVEQEMSAIDAGANRVFQRQSVKIEEILTALKTALFPRVLQAQPRSKQGAEVSAAPRQAAPKAEANGQPAAVAPVHAGSLELPGERLDAQQIDAPALHKKILIIDGDESVAGIYRSQIEAAGYEVEVALDGETGFHDLFTINPDALLLDLLLPGLSGSEILKKTRAQKKFEKTPILVFTNIYTRDVEEEAKAAGAYRIFNKAAATPRDIVDALNEIFLPRQEVAAPVAPMRAPIKFDVGEASSPAPVNAEALEAIRGNGAAANDIEFQSEIRESMLQSAPDYVKSLRGLLQVLLRSQGEAEAQQAQLLELYTRVHSLTANAAIAGLTKVARLSGALEAMLREFQARPDGLNASTKRTLTQAMDFLAILFTGAATHESAAPLEEQILVVDDEIISRKVIGHSLEKAGLKSTAVSHPDEALTLLAERPFDLIFLDVEMPGMDGFELCKRLRALPRHSKTPVIFVTALGGFESKAKSSLSGGDDFIGKPFSYIELAVKALMYVLRGSLRDRSAANPEAGASPQGRSGVVTRRIPPVISGVNAPISKA